jgi:hypothetical protein
MGNYFIALIIWVAYSTACLCISLYSSIRTYTYAHTYAFVYVCTHAYTHIRIYIHTYTYVHTYIHTYIHAHTYIPYTHICIYHTYVYKRNSSGVETRASNSSTLRSKYTNPRTFENLSVLNLSLPPSHQW